MAGTVFPFVLAKSTSSAPWVSLALRMNFQMLPLSNGPSATMREVSGSMSFMPQASRYAAKKGFSAAALSTPAYRRAPSTVLAASAFRRSG